MLKLAKGQNRAKFGEISMILCYRDGRRHREQQMSEGSTAQKYPKIDPQNRKIVFYCNFTLQF